MDEKHLLPQISFGSNTPEGKKTKTAYTKLRHHKRNKVMNVGIRTIARKSTNRPTHNARRATIQRYERLIFGLGMPVL